MTASPNNTVALPDTLYQTNIITDAHGNQWTIAPNGQITINGVVDTPTGNVIELAYVNGQIWQENNQGLWWEKTTTAIGQWNYKGTIDPLNGASFNFVGDAPLTINSIVADNYTGSTAPSQVQQVPGFCNLQTNHINLYHDNYQLTGFAYSLTITGSSVIAHGSAFSGYGADHNNDPIGVSNNGTMSVQGSTLSIGYLNGGTGSVVASGGSVINTQGSATSETIQLHSSMLDIGGSHGTRPLFIGGSGSDANTPGAAPYGLGFGAHVTMDVGSTIILANTAATSMLFLKSGEAFLYAGVGKVVADIHVSGVPTLFAHTQSGGIWGEQTVLTATPTAHDIHSFTY
jgi:hypothetical protein